MSNRPSDDEKQPPTMSGTPSNNMLESAMTMRECVRRFPPTNAHAHTHSAVFETVADCASNAVNSSLLANIKIMKHLNEKWCTQSRNQTTHHGPKPARCMQELQHSLTVLYSLVETADRQDRQTARTGEDPSPQTRRHAPHFKGEIAQAGEARGVCVAQASTCSRAARTT